MLTNQERAELTKKILEMLNENYVLKAEGETDQDCMAHDILVTFNDFLNYRGPSKITIGTQMIATERNRQILEEGWTAEHDANEQRQGDLATAGAAYILDYAARSPDYEEQYRMTIAIGLIDLWPWALKWWKPTPKDPVRQLTKAGALIAAEIDRILSLQDK